jgi:hypothetical protein
MFPIFMAMIIVAAVAASIGVAIWNSRMRNKRRQEMAGWAQANCLDFLPEKDNSLWLRYPLFKCLQRGEDHYAYNIALGTSGHRATCGFDYHYETHSSDSKGNRQTHHHYFSALVVDAGLPLKPLYIRPECLFDKVAEFVGFEDIKFESTEFSEKFFVKAPDRRWAYDVINQKTMEMMLVYPRFHIEFQGTQVMAYHDNRTLTLGEFSSALKVVNEMLDNLPPDVVEELKAMRSAPQPQLLYALWAVPSSK